LNSFSFHETDSLAQDLAKLLQQPMIGSGVETNAARQTPGESSAAFPGIILLYDGHPCAAISYARESDATVVVAPPVILIDATNDVRSNLYEVLLKRVKRLSVDAGFLQMNFLQQDSSVESLFLSLLAEQRFVPAAKDSAVGASDFARVSCSSSCSAQSGNPDRQCSRRLHVSSI
jgi:hypothetical protein